MQKFILKAGIGLAFSLVTGLALAQSTTSSVLVNQPWARATPPGAKVAGGFMVLENRSGAADRLIAATADVSGVVEIHEMAMEKDVMKMRQIPGLDLAAGRTMDLKPGGYHVMLMELKQQMKGGDVVPITLVFEDDAKKRFTQDIKAPVTALGGGNTAMPAGHGGMKH